MKETSGKEVLAPVGLSIKEATRLTGLSRSYLWKAVKSGELGHCRLGRRVIFLPRHLEEFLSASEVRRDTVSVG